MNEGEGITGLGGVRKRGRKRSGVGKISSE